MQDRTAGAQVVPTKRAKKADPGMRPSCSLLRPVDREWRIAMLLLTLLVVAFIGVVVTLTDGVWSADQDTSQLDRVDAQCSSAKMNTMLDRVLDNTEAATSNMAMATASIAHALAQQIHPRVEHALNATEAVVDHLRDFSFHVVDDRRGRNTAAEGHGCAHSTARAHDASYASSRSFASGVHKARLAIVRPRTSARNPSSGAKLENGTTESGAKLENAPAHNPSCSANPGDAPAQARALTPLKVACFPNEGRPFEASQSHR